jgi:hypothetical protein
MYKALLKHKSRLKCSILYDRTGYTYDRTGHKLLYICI